jgi:hypothetical protein
VLLSENGFKILRNAMSLRISGNERWDCAAVRNWLRAIKKRDGFLYWRVSDENVLLFSTGFTTSRDTEGFSTGG